MNTRQRAAKQVRRQLKEPIKLLGDGREPIPRDEILQRKMDKIEPQFHKGINNRRLQTSSIKDFKRFFGLQGGKIVGEKEFNEIADLEDECIVKMRELTAEN